MGIRIYWVFLNEICLLDNCYIIICNCFNKKKLKGVKVIYLLLKYIGKVLIKCYIFSKFILLFIGIVNCFNRKIE